MEGAFKAHTLESYEKRKRLLDYLIKGASLIAILATIPELIYWVTDTLIVVSVILINFGVCYFLNKKHTNSAANLVILTVTSLVFVQCIQTGLSSMIFCFYMPLLIGIPFIIDNRKIGLILFHMILPILLCTYVMFFHQSSDESYRQLSEGFQSTNSKINFLCALTQCGFFAWFIIRDHTISSKLILLSKAKIEYKNAHLQKTNSEMDHLVYSISHDLRAPIASALGLIEISKLETDPEKLRYYETLKEACLRRLDNFIYDILNYLKNNRLEVEVSEVHIKEEILNCIEMNSVYNEQVSVSIDCDFEGEFYTDKNRLRMILNNIISNAFRYSKTTHVDKTIHIKVKNQFPVLEISIADNGVGINKEYMDKIFDMFFKTDEKTKGSGLGLYITKEAISKIEGTINVWSEKGVGSIFTLSIPNLKGRVFNTLSEQA
ncbi:HAMP domain-containing sensor histidine kinase [uncultured Cytophaga sp.]|uniref:sensor histidine kinase n=1 Tax=uncultured Cytophaga sp. TaxID=160238 RepID=UPI00260E2486|nr:HAMP domain-containing sensor histidine kinase [uncultured Cytophaga sp.]